jgi:hypothetical protein
VHRYFDYGIATLIIGIFKYITTKEKNMQKGTVALPLQSWYKIEIKSEEALKMCFLVELWSTDSTFEAWG